MARLRVGILGYDQVNALDLAGPAEAFATARGEREAGKSEPAY